MITKNLAVVTADAPLAVGNPTSNPFGPLLDPSSYGMMIKISEVFAKSSMVPSHFRGKPADVFVTLQLAWRLNLDPMTALQSVYVVSGRPGLAATLVIALANGSGVFKGPITYETTGDGDSLTVTAIAVLSSTGKTVTASVDMALAKGEGWTKNPKYKTMPEHMLIYRSATWLVRRYCPQVLLGMQTTEELHDMTAARKPDGSNAGISAQSNKEADGSIYATTISLLNNLIDSANTDSKWDAAMSQISGIKSSIKAVDLAQLRERGRFQKSTIFADGHKETVELKPDPPQATTSEYITQDQINRLYTLAGKEGIDDSELKSALGIESAMDILTMDYDEIIEKLPELAKRGGKIPPIKKESQS